MYILILNKNANLSQFTSIHAKKSLVCRYLVGGGKNEKAPTNEMLS